MLAVNGKVLFYLFSKGYGLKKGGGLITMHIKTSRFSLFSQIPCSWLLLFQMSLLDFDFEDFTHTTSLFAFLICAHDGGFFKKWQKHSDFLAAHIK